MNKSIHPAYGPVVFRDTASDTSFLTRSTLGGDVPAGHKSVEWTDGNTYPLVEVDISSASHPFYTGKSRVVDTAGRVEKFNRRYSRSAPAPSGFDASTDGAPS